MKKGSRVACVVRCGQGYWQAIFSDSGAYANAGATCVRIFRTRAKARAFASRWLNPGKAV